MGLFCFATFRFCDVCSTASGIALRVPWRCGGRVFFFVMLWLCGGLRGSGGRVLMVVVVVVVVVCACVCVCV